MLTHDEAPAVVVEDHQECADKKNPGAVPETRQIPVAYEEVTLTEEAAEILERAKKAAVERPARPIRRLPVGDPADFRG